MTHRFHSGVVARGLMLLTLGAGVLASPHANAWDPMHAQASQQVAFPPGHSVPCNGGGAHFSGPPQVVVHTAELNGVGPFEFLQILAAFASIHDVVGDIADTSLEITGTSLSTDAFAFKSWYGDATPTIHVGFSDNATAPAQGDGNFVAGQCLYNEAHIRIRNPSVYDWEYSEPEVVGSPFWDTGRFINGVHSFRLMYLHELMHTFGLAHTNDSYSIMTRSDRPWHNRPAGEQFQPLPDDVEGIRALYPGQRGDPLSISLLNTWHDVNDLSIGVARQKMLCKPSRGDAWADSWDNSMLSPNMAADDGLETCGDPASGVATEVCPGDVLRTRVAVGNYDTAEVDMKLRLWFSDDDIWDGAAGGDVMSPDVHEFSLSRQGSSLQGRMFAVPQLAEGDYYVIEKGIATATDGDKTGDWIPLRGQIHVLSPLECPATLDTDTVYGDGCSFGPCDPAIELDPPEPFDEPTPDLP